MQGSGGKTKGIQYDNVFRGAYIIIKNEGITRGLYKGIFAAWFRESIYSSLRLGLYEPFKRILGATDPAHTPLWKKIVSGGMSGIVGAALANPTDILKIRMQAWEGQPESLKWHANKIYQKDGIAGFYNAIQLTMIRAMVLNSVKLSTYDHIKHTILNLNILEEGYTVHFIASLIAGVCMATATAPFDICRTRIMNQMEGEK